MTTSDIKMGLKRVIMQRLKSSENIDHNTEPTEKRHTDFSIKTILSDSTPSTTKKDSHLQLTQNILDLSIAAARIQHQQPSNHHYHHHHQQQYHQYQHLLVQQAYKYSNSSSISTRNLTDISHTVPSSITERHTQKFSEILVRPKVFKFWENSGSINCSDCDLYFNSLNLSTTLKGRNYYNISNIVKSNQEIVQKFVNLRKGSCVQHQLQKDDEISYKCKTCDKVFGCAITLETHEKTHKASKYECVDCGKGFSQLRNYKYHLSVHRGTKEFAAECPECGKTFNDKGYLSSHMKIHRNKKEYECPYCPKSFNQRVAFNMHVRIHTGVKPHKCNECGKRFSRKMLLKQHMRTHSGEKPYQCSICGKSFADRSNMTLHHRLHSGIKPFSCPICPKAFTKKHHLKTHLNYHTGCKPYVCPHPNCNQAFTQSSNMRTHAKKCQFRPVESTVNL